MAYSKETIAWADHFFLSDTLSMEEVKERLKPYVRETTGYVIAENKRVIAICSTIEPDGEFTEVNYLMKRCVIKRSVL